MMNNALASASLLAMMMTVHAQQSKLNEKNIDAVLKTMKPEDKTQLLTSNVVRTRSDGTQCSCQGKQTMDSDVVVLLFERSVYVENDIRKSTKKL
ncbi:MAG TPA: hypothetical protein VIQ97_00430 [Prevotella sp.]